MTFSFLDSRQLATGAWIAYSLGQPQGGDYSGERFVDIPKGTGARQIAALLAGKGVISSPILFLTARALMPFTH